MTYCATIFNLLLAHLVRRRAFAPSVSAATVASTVRAYRVGWAGYAIATLTALVLPVVSFGAYLAIAVYYLVPRGVDADIGGA